MLKKLLKLLTPWETRWQPIPFRQVRQVIDTEAYLAGNGIQFMTVPDEPVGTTAKEQPMSKVHEHLNLLGHIVKDRVTGFEGVVTSVGFDLYGCIQAIVHPGLGADGKVGDSCWFDINRLVVTSTKPVMKQPDFVKGPQANGDQGPAEKPAQAFCDGIRRG